MRRISAVVLALMIAAAAAATQAAAQQTHSRLFDITKNQLLRVCVTPLYYAITYRDPKTQQLEGIDIDLSKVLADSLGAKLQYVETTFSTFIADLQANKCDVAMFGIGITLKRAQAVEFTKPYLQTGIYAIVRKGGPIAKWDDIDRTGQTVAVTLGSYIEPFMRGYLKNAKVEAIESPASPLGELAASRAVAAIVDYPTAVHVRDEFDWAEIVAPPKVLLATPFGYVVAPGDQIWLNYLNVFVDTIKRDGTLAAAAKKNKLGPILIP